VGPRAGLDVVAKAKTFCPYRESNPGRPVTILTELPRFRFRTCVFSLLHRIKCSHVSTAQLEPQVVHSWHKQYLSDVYHIQPLRSEDILHTKPKLILNKGRKLQFTLPFGFINGLSKLYRAWEGLVSPEMAAVPQGKGGVKVHALFCGIRALYH
jgi:hypothetical protein